MGGLYKPQSTRWIDASGKRVATGTPGAKKRTTKNKFYWAKYRDANGKECRESLKVKDKTNAKKMLADIEQRVENERAGVVVESHLEQAKRPLSEHLDAWYASLEQLDITARRKKEVPQRMRKLIRLTGWTKLSDIKADSVREALNKLGVSSTTRNHYLRHVKQFIHWCIPERLQYNPLTKVKAVKSDPDLRHERRHLSEEEVAKFLTTTESSTAIRGKLDGKSRALLYALALGTGFRRGELQSLTRESFDLESRTVTVEASYSKHRERDTQALAPWLVERLKVWFAENKPLWPNLTKHTSKMIRKDLADAGIPYTVMAGERELYADFHALRHTFSTMVGQIEPSSTHLMRLTRHKSHALVLRYVKTTAENKARCVNQLVDPFAQSQNDNPKS